MGHLRRVLRVHGGPVPDDFGGTSLMVSRRDGQVRTASRAFTARLRVIFKPMGVDEIGSGGRLRQLSKYRTALNSATCADLGGPSIGLRTLVSSSSAIWDIDSVANCRDCELQVLTEAADLQSGRHTPPLGHLGLCTGSRCVRKRWDRTRTHGKSRRRIHVTALGERCGDAYLDARN
jgi:hypothetical protein